VYSGRYLARLARESTHKAASVRPGQIRHALHVLYCLVCGHCGRYAHCPAPSRSFEYIDGPCLLFVFHLGLRGRNSPSVTVTPLMMEVSVLPEVGELTKNVWVCDVPRRLDTSDRSRIVCPFQGHCACMWVNTSLLSHSALSESHCTLQPDMSG